MKKTLKVEGLDCPVCAGELEEIVSKIEGVSYASLSFVHQKLKIDCDGEATLQKVIEAVNGFEEARVVEEIEKTENGFAKWLPVLFSAIFLGAGFFPRLAFNTAATQIVQYVCYALAYLTAGYKVLFATVKNLFKGKIFDENFLMTVASVGAVFLGEYLEAVLVMLLYQTGETLQAIAVGASRKSVAKLMDLKTETANRYVGDGETESVSPDCLAVGDMLLIKAGEKIPCDGVLLSPRATLDTKPLTGEPEPRSLSVGEELLSGTVNAGNAFQMRVTRLVQDSAAQKILDLLENSADEKAQPEKFITKFAKVYTPVVCLLAVLVAFLPPLFSGGQYWNDFPRWLKTALTFLVVSCPCALVISVPLTYFSGIGACARKGVLVKGATYLDAASRIKTVALDKTGTLTEGDFGVVNVLPKDGITKETLVFLVAAVERASSHPIAKAFEDVETPLFAENVEEIAGKGLRAETDGQRVLVGNVALLEDEGVVFERLETANTVLYVAKEGVYLGAIEVGDKLRAEAKAAVGSLAKMGLTTVILTGDNESRAKSVAQEVGVDEWQAGLLPDGKLQAAKEWKKRGGLLYVGDGINDAPVMQEADCAVSMGKLGSAASVEASDFVLIADDLTGVPAMVALARKTGRIVKQNIVFSVAMKAAFMVLGVFGLPLSLAVFADVGVMLLAVLNALRVQIR